MKTLTECLGVLKGPDFDPKWLNHPSWMALMNETCAEFLVGQGWTVKEPRKPFPAFNDCAACNGRGLTPGSTDVWNAKTCPVCEGKPHPVMPTDTQPRIV